MLGPLQRRRRRRCRRPWWRARRGLSGFRGVELSLRSWLHRIAASRCLTLTETRQRRVLPVDRPVPAAHVEPAEITVAASRSRARVTSMPSEPAARLEQRESIELAFVAALAAPPAPAAALVLRDVLGFSAAEAAGVLDVSVPALNSALQRARVTVGAKSQPDASDAESGRVADLYARARAQGDVDAMVALTRCGRGLLDADRRRMLAAPAVDDTRACTARRSARCPAAVTWPVGRTANAPSAPTAGTTGAAPPLQWRSTSCRSAAVWSPRSCRS